MSSIGQNDFSTFLPLLTNTHLVIPDLRPLFRRWPAALNPHYTSLVRRFEAKLVELVPNPKIREQMRKVDIPLFASLWWPTATLHRLETVVYYSLWLFLWDDEIDGAGLVGDDEKQADTEEVKKSRAMEYVKFHLGVMDEANGSQEKHEPVAPNKATRIVKEPAGWIKDSGNRGMIARLVVELERYMDGCGVEQMHLQRGYLPSLKEYWDCRMGTSAVATYSALTEYLVGVRVPSELFEMEEMETMWNEVNRNVSIINDTLSLKKEINGSLYSLIPVTMKETGQDAQAVIDDLVVALEASADAFDQAAESLLNHVRDNEPHIFPSVDEYVRGLQTMMTGSLYWQLAADRYGISKYIQDDNSLIIPL